MYVNVNELVNVSNPASKRGTELPCVKGVGGINVRAVRTFHLSTRDAAYPHVLELTWQATWILEHCAYPSMASYVNDYRRVTTGESLITQCYC